MSDLKEVQRHLEAARRSAGTGDTAGCLEHAEKALEIAKEIDPPEPARAEVFAAVYTELALARHRAGDKDGARAAFDAADAITAKAIEDSADPRFTILRVTLQINRAATGIDPEGRETSRDRLTEALALLDGLGTKGMAVDVLRLGALQNRAAIETDLGALEDAEQSLRAALEIGAGTVTTAPALLGQVVTIAGRLAAVLRARGKALEGVEVVERASRWAEAAYDAGSPQALPAYVTAQLQLMQANASAGRFAQAEDPYWRAMEVAASPSVVLTGVGLYAGLLRQSDEALEKGDLPRAEVVDAFDELLDRLRGMEPPEEIIALVSARRAVLVERDVEEGDAVLSTTRTSEVPTIRELSRGLASDLEWARDQIGQLV